MGLPNLPKIAAFMADLTKSLIPPLTLTLTLTKVFLLGMLRMLVIMSRKNEKISGPKMMSFWCKKGGKVFFKGMPQTHPRMLIFS